MFSRRSGARFNRGRFGGRGPASPPWIVPGFGSSLKCDLLASNYEPGEAGGAFAIQDLSGNGNHASQPVTALQPTPTAGVIDGKLGIVHVGTAQEHLYVPGIGSLLNGIDKPFSVGIYMEPLLLDSNGKIVCWGNTANDTNYLFVQAPQFNGPAYHVSRRAGGGDGGATTDSATATDRALLYVFDGVNGAIYINGANKPLTDSEHAVGQSLNCNTFCIGAWFTSDGLSHFWSGVWRRICVWNAVLDAGQIADWNTNVRLH